VRQRAGLTRVRLLTEKAEVPRLLRRAPNLLVEWKGTDVVLTNADNLRRFRVDERLLELLSSLDQWTSEGEIAGPGRPHLRGEDLDRLVDLGVIETRDDGMDEAESPQTWWTPVELAVHRHQTAGSTGEGRVGAGPPPVAKSRPPGEVIALPEPGPPPADTLFAVLERRRSIRHYGDRPLELQDLSAVLYHSCRVKEVWRDEVLGEQALRPFPGGGARSELEVYVIANQVEGLVAGAYSYDPQAGDLVFVRPADEQQRALNRRIDDATGGALGTAPPAVLVVTAVFGRIMWKYRDIGLSLIYQDVGCLYQTLYLVATALGLAPCAIGAGYGLENTRWLGLDPLVEAQVGSFVLGPRNEP